MVKPFINEDDVKIFQARMQATEILGKKYGITFTPLGNINSLNPMEVITAVSVDRLEKSSDKLNILTWVLIVLTFILMVVGIANIIFFIKCSEHSA